VEFRAKTGAKLHRQGKPTIVLTLEIFNLNAQDEKTVKSAKIGP